MKKKVLTISIILLSLMMLLLLIKCQKSESGTSSKSSASQYTQSQSKGLTSSEINRLTVNALLRELKSISYYDIDPSSCTYSINKTGKEGPYTVVYGTVYYYDKYGQLTKGPGGYSGSFTVKIDGWGSTSCYIR